MLSTRLAISVAVLVASLAIAGAAYGNPSKTDHRLVVTNDNRHPAGRLVNGTLTLALRASTGRWQPEGREGPTLEVEALGEIGRPLAIPAPLIRVAHDTAIHATIRNDLDAVLRVHGLCGRAAATCDPLDIPIGETRDVHFTADRVGTHYYWATTTGMPLGLRGSTDTQLSGAFIVDPPGTAPEPDRIFVLTEWTNLTRAQLADLARADDIGLAFEALQPRLTLLMNGLSWPATERVTYRVGDRVHWRVINLTTQYHPMHLHGFYFDVNSLGDGRQDVPASDGQKRHVVTQLLRPGGTMAMSWTPEREGNWLFHCHIMQHVSPLRRLTARAEDADPHAAHHGSKDTGFGMAGMVLGITVLASDKPAPPATAGSPVRARELILALEPKPDHYKAEPGYGVVLSGDRLATPDGPPSIPGPPLVLERGEPVEITLVNHLPEATAIHWHGIELDSFYDGVHGWGGAGAKTTPLIEPGAAFTVRFTPPRTGTFIYHTHFHDHQQLTSGLYGALVVVDAGETFDADRDHVLVVGRARVPLPQATSLVPNAPTLLNGEVSPRFVWKAGTRHRVRFVNITPDDVLVVTVQGADGPISWTPLTKDGAPVPAADAKAMPARQIIAVGETYDFEFDVPAGRRNLWIEARTLAGKWQVQGHVIVK
jgi:FtsP/CotA-like multicopper oxidase with cupredoxin domain